MYGESRAERTVSVTYCQLNPVFVELFLLQKKTIKTEILR
jgi:hypothetical protein